MTPPSTAGLVTPTPRPAGPTTRKVKPLADRLWSRVDRAADDTCWLWQGCADRKGYGQISVGAGTRRLILTHRAAWEVTHGPIPVGLVVRHDCDNPPCCNPSHLRLGTQADNVQDAVDRGRNRAARGMASGAAKLTWEQVEEIRRRHVRRRRPEIGTGSSASELAREFGISPQHVQSIVNYRWRRDA